MILGILAAVLAARGAPPAAPAPTAAEPAGRGGTRDRGAKDRGGVALAGAWAVLLPAAFVVVSQVHPLFTTRYLVFCLPGVALLAALCAARVPAPVAVVALVAVAACGIPHQVQERGPAGHGEDLRALDAAVREYQIPGSAAVFEPWSVRRVTQLEPELWQGSADPVLARPGEISALFAARATVTAAVAGLARAGHLVVVSRTGGGALDLEDATVLGEIGRDFVVRRAVRVPGFEVEFLDRRR